MATKYFNASSVVFALMLLGTQAALAQGAPARGGFKLPPLLMQSTAFEDGGIIMASERDRTSRGGSE